MSNFRPEATGSLFYLNMAQWLGTGEQTVQAFQLVDPALFQDTPQTRLPLACLDSFVCEDTENDLDFGVRQRYGEQGPDASGGTSYWDLEPEIRMTLSEQLIGLLTTEIRARRRKSERTGQRLLKTDFNSLREFDVSFELDPHRAKGTRKARWILTNTDHNTNRSGDLIFYFMDDLGTWLPLTPGQSIALFPGERIKLKQNRNDGKVVAFVLPTFI